MAFGTYKPCHGCGQGHRYRAVSEVCGDCKAALRAGRAVTNEAQASDEKGVLFRLTKEWPSFYIPSSDPETGRKLREAFEKLARASLKAVRSKKDPYSQGVEALPPEGDTVRYFSTHDAKATLWTGPRRVAAAITELDLAVRKALMLSREIGEEEGSDLLRQIAGGKLSIGELNDLSVEAGRRKREG